MIELFGFKGCPFAWRARLACAEKGAQFRWTATDEPPSPLMREGGFELVESLVIAQYIDENNAGRALQPQDARDRAQMRLRIAQLASKLEFHYEPGEPVAAQTRDQVEQALAKLGDGWLGGAEPDLSDLAAWPFVHYAALARLNVPKQYLERVRARASFNATKPG